jgi:hypothetical protein
MWNIIQKCCKANSYPLRANPHPIFPFPASFELMEAPVPTKKRLKIILAASKSALPLSVCQTIGSGDRE